MSDNDLSFLDDELEFIEKNSGSKVNWYKVQKENRVRFIKNGSGGPFIIRAHKHFEGPFPEKFTAVWCGRMLGDPCLYCESAESAKENGDDGAARMFPATRYLANILDEDGDRYVFEMPMTVAKAVMSTARKWGNPADPEDGYWFDIERKKTGSGPMNVEYIVLPDREAEPISDYGVLDDVYDLESLIRPLELAQQRECFGISSGDSDDEDEEPKKEKKEKKKEQAPETEEPSNGGEMSADELRAKLAAKMKEEDE